jgi:uncharacterized protein
MPIVAVARFDNETNDPALTAFAGVSALLLAQYSNRSDVVTRFLTYKPESDAFEAASLGLSARLADLLDSDATLLTASSADGFTPLHLAAYFGHVGTVRLLLERDAPIDTKSQNSLGVTPLHSVSAGRHLQIVQLLLTHSSNVNARQDGKWSALHSAAQHGDAAIAMELLRYGGDRTALNAEGKSAARIARESGHHELAVILEANRPMKEVGK